MPAEPNPPTRVGSDDAPTAAAMIVWTTILMLLAAFVVAVVVAFVLARAEPPSPMAGRVKHMATVFIGLATALTIVRAGVKVFSKS